MENEIKNSDKNINYCNEYETRCQKIKALEKINVVSWPESIKVTLLAQDAHSLSPDNYHNSFTLAGRLRSRREHGKSIFLTIEDNTGTIQIYFKNDSNDELNNIIIHVLDIGDYIWISGPLFITKTGELTVRIERCGLLSKCLRPIPNSFEGLHNIETRYRKRYLDLLVHKNIKEVFKKRSLIIQTIRSFLHKNSFCEVETPMLHPIPGGANAKPFITHHNALDTDFYLRVAPELYLKRLVVGGFERVYEINKNFRNEGVSIRHNPEFTMLEFYMAHHDYIFIMGFVENLIRNALLSCNDSLIMTFHGNEIDFSKDFERITPIDAVIKYAHIDHDLLLPSVINITLKNHNIDFLHHSYHEKIFMLFEKYVEKKLIQPTFIIDFPIEISPLSKRSENNPLTAARFELFIGGMEIGNGFNELNDPFDQAERFKKQVESHAAGNEEAMFYDADYINALEYGMPPCVGVGIGIDRLCMIATNSNSIKDVILFPTMKPL